MSFKSLARIFRNKSNVLCIHVSLKHDQGLNDSTSGQIGEEPRSVPEQTIDLKNEQMKTARKMSRDM